MVSPLSYGTSFIIRYGFRLNTKVERQLVSRQGTSLSLVVSTGSRPEKQGYRIKKHTARTPPPLTLNAKHGTKERPNADGGSVRRTDGAPSQRVMGGQ